MKIDNANKIVVIREIKNGHCLIGRPVIFRNMLKEVSNYRYIDFIDVNCVGVEDGKIFFVSGYTREKGMFLKYV